MELLGLLEQALSSSGAGISVKTNNPQKLQQSLYTVRKGIDRFAALSIQISPLSPDNEIRIIRNG